MWRAGKILYYNMFVGQWRSTEINGFTNEESKRFLDKMREYKDKKCKIALVGLTGQGKSSFVNTVLSVMRGHLITPAFTRLSKKGSNTKEVNPYRIKDGKHYWETTFLDCQGYGTEEEVDKFNIEVFKNILKTGEWKKSNDEEGTDYAVDAVILFVAYHTDFEELRDKVLTEEIVCLLSDCNMPVFLMITHIDSSVEREEDFVVKLTFKDYNMRSAVERASHAMRFDRNKILLQCNYGDNNQKLNSEQNVLTLYNLWYVLETVFSKRENC